MAIQRFQYHMPLDPSCPDNPINGLYEDPMSKHAPLEDIVPMLERKHLKTCERCVEYGCENIEVVGP